MPAYERAFPVGITDLKIRDTEGNTYTLVIGTDTFIRIGKDGEEVILQLFSGDEFIGEIQEGHWKKGWDNDISVFTSSLQGGNLELTGVAKVPGDESQGWINSQLPVAMVDGTQIIVGMEVPVDVVDANRDLRFEFYLRAEKAVDDPFDDSNYINFYTSVTDGGLKLFLKKKINGSLSTLESGKDYNMGGDRGTGAVEATIWKMIFNGKPGTSGATMSVYLKQAETLTLAESATENEIDNSPFDVSGLAYQMVHVSFSISTENATYFGTAIESANAAIVSYVRVSYPDLNYEFKIPKENRGTGDVQLWDTMGSSDESLWQQVLDRNHDFVGDVNIQNDLVRLEIERNARNGLKLSGYSGGWVTPCDSFYVNLISASQSLNYPEIIGVEAVSPEQVTLKCRISGDVWDRWEQVAPKLTEGGIYSLVVLDGVIYGGTEGSGKLHRWNGVDAWEQVAPKLGDETIIFSLVVLDGKIYGGTFPNGLLYRWNEVDAWEQVAPQFGAITHIFSLVVLDGEIYGGTQLEGLLLRWNGVDAWEQVAPTLVEVIIYSLAVLDGVIYGGTGGSGNLYRWNGVDAWEQVAPKLGAEARILSLAVLDGEIYGGTRNQGKLQRWNGVDAWEVVAPTSIQIQGYIYSLAVLDGVIYGGTRGDGNLQRWNGVDAWEQVAPKLGAETHILSLAVLDGKIYGGTNVNGKLYRAYSEAELSYYMDFNVTLKRGSNYIEIQPTQTYPTDTVRFSLRNSTPLRFHYVGDNEIADMNLDMAVSNTTMTDNFLMAFDLDTEMLIYMGMNLKPDSGLYAGKETGLSVRDIIVADIGNYKLYVGVTPFSLVSYLFAEAEDEAKTGEIVDDSSASEGEAINLDAQNEYVRYDIIAGTDLPAGEYLAKIRIKDLNQIANDVGIEITNEDETEDRSQDGEEVSYTVTESYTYYGVPFFISDADVSGGDTIRINVKKLTADANEILVDYFVSHPIGDGKDWPMDIVHNALYKNSLLHDISAVS